MAGSEKTRRVLVSRMFFKLKCVLSNMDEKRVCVFEVESIDVYISTFSRLASLGVKVFSG